MPSFPTSSSAIATAIDTSISTPSSSSSIEGERGEVLLQAHCCSKVPRASVTPLLDEDEEVLQAHPSKVPRLPSNDNNNPLQAPSASSSSSSSATGISAGTSISTSKVVPARLLEAACLIPPVPLEAQDPQDQQQYSSIQQQQQGSSYLTPIFSSTWATSSYNKHSYPILTWEELSASSKTVEDTMTTDEGVYTYRREPYLYTNNAGAQEQTWAHVIAMDPERIEPSFSVNEAMSGRVFAFDRRKISVKYLEDVDGEGESSSGKKREAREYSGKDIKRVYDRRSSWGSHVSKIASELREKETEPFVVVGDSNILFNDHVTGWSNGQAIHAAGERLDSRVYSSFVAFKDGSMKIIDIQYRKDNQGQLRPFEFPSGVDLTDSIRFATSGQRVVRAGREVAPIELKDEWTDLRWVFKFPFLTSLAGDAFFGLDQLIDDDGWMPNALAHQALRGEPVVLRLHVWGGKAKVSEDDLRKALVDPESNYIDVGSPDNVKEVGQFAFHTLKNSEERVITLRLRQGRYPHNAIAILRDSRIGLLQIEGKSGRIGITLDEMTTYFAQKLDVQDAILLDNGADVKMLLKNPVAAAGTEAAQELVFVNGPNTGARNLHFGALGFGIKK